MIPKGKLLAVQEGDFIRKGDLIIDGSPVPHDILNILGVEALANYLVKEVQDVYRHIVPNLIFELEKRFSLLKGGVLLPGTVKPFFKVLI